MTTFVFSVATAAVLLASGCMQRNQQNNDLGDVASASRQNPICRNPETWTASKCGQDQRQVIVTGLARIDPEFSNSLFVSKGIILCYGRVTYYKKGELKQLKKHQEQGWKRGMGVWLGFLGCYPGTGYRLNDNQQPTGANVVTPLEVNEGDLNIGEFLPSKPLAGYVGKGDSDLLRSLCEPRSEANCELVNDRNTLRIQLNYSR